MKDSNEKNAVCKLLDFFRPMTNYTIKEDLELSLALFEDEEATKPLCSCKFGESKKINLLRTVAFIGALIAFVTFLGSLCCCIRQGK